jgi:hypothetical protein
MNVRIPPSTIAAAVAIASAATVVAVASPGPATRPRDMVNAAGAIAAARPAKVVRVKDARLKFEMNATDRDGGVQLFVDADSWKELSVFDPSGSRIFRSTTSGRMATQGGTELFLESAEPTFRQLSPAALLRRFPKGRYAVRGTGLAGERYVGTAVLSHSLPAGPELVSPLPAHGPQKLDDTTVVWKPVAPPAGSAIIGYQVLVVQPDTGLRALPKITLDVTMPPTATSLRIPPGFLRAGTEYEWEVLAIERGGNQTLSSSTFTTVP